MEEEKKVFVATAEAKGKAKQFRLFAMLAWIVAIGLEIYAILKLISNETMTMLIIAIVIILALAMTGSWLWKRANRMDPASEKDKFRYFVQNQLGAIMAVLAFLPLVIMIFTNKDLDGKSKGIAGAVGVVALLVAGIFGVDFNPASIEKYTEEIQAQTEKIKELNGTDNVYWTTAGNKYHVFGDCHHIRDREKFNGSVEKAWEERKIGDSELCKTCEKRAIKERDAKSDSENNVEDVVEELEETVSQ